MVRFGEASARRMNPVETCLSAENEKLKDTVSRLTVELRVVLGKFNEYALYFGLTGGEFGILKAIKAGEEVLK
jgi:hypothetical protein